MKLNSGCRRTALFSIAYYYKRFDVERDSKYYKSSNVRGIPFKCSSKIRAMAEKRAVRRRPEFNLRMYILRNIYVPIYCFLTK